MEVIGEGKSVESNQANAENAAEFIDNNRILVIPLRDASGKETDDGITVDLSTIPGAEIILGPLKAEFADLSIWLTIALEYFQQKRYKDFENFMQVATGEDIHNFYSTNLLGRLKLLNANAAYCAFMFNKIALESKDIKTKALDYKKRASALIDRTIELDVLKSFDPVWVTKGCLQVYAKDFSAALNSYDHALVINPDNVLASIGMAKIYFAQAKYMKALEEYRKVLTEHTHCPVSVRVGLGLCFFRLHSYKRAYDCFSRAIALDPRNIDAITSLAILQLSVAAGYEDIEPTQRSQFPSKRALIESALDALQLSHKISDIQPVVLNHLANYFFQKEDKDLDQIRGLAKKSIKHSVGNKAIRAESLYILGRNYHFQATKMQNKMDEDRKLRRALGDTTLSASFRARMEQQLLETSEIKALQINMREKYAGAKDFFTEGLKEWPAFLLNKYSMAQIEMENVSFNRPKERGKVREVYKTVKRYLEDVLQKYHTDRDTLFLYGHIQLKLDDKAAALSTWKKIVDYNPDDVETWSLLANTLHVLERVLLLDMNKRFIDQRFTSTKNNQEKALQSYKKAIHVVKSSGQLPDIELVNNVGVLKWSLGQLHAAEKDFKYAIHIVSMDSSHRQKEGQFILTREKVIPYFNLACVREHLGNVDAAEGIYKEIRSKFPFFIEAILRLGIILASRGEYTKAETYFEEAKRRDPKNLSTLLLLSQSYQQTENSDRFIKNNVEIQKIAFDNAYHRLSDANLHLKNAQKRILTKSVKPEVLKTIKKEIEKAMGIYSTLLQQTDRSNAFAANGFACTLATQRSYGDALVVLGKLKEYMANIDDDRIRTVLSKNLYKNLGHLSLNEHIYDKAITYYENCLRRYVSPNDYNYVINPKKPINFYPAEIRNCLANAYILGKQPETAELLIQQVIKNDPSNVVSWYNLGISKIHESSLFLKEKEARRNVDAFHVAYENLTVAKEIFLWVAATKTSIQPKVEDEIELYLEEPITPLGSPLGNPFESKELPDSTLKALLKRAHTSRMTMGEEHNAFLIRQNLKVVAEIPVPQGLDVPVELEAKNMRAIAQRAPNSAHFTKVARAVVAVEQCDSLVAICNKHSSHHENKRKQAEAKRKKLEDEMMAEEARKKTKLEEQNMAELREQEALQRRIEAQEAQNKAIARRLRDAEESFKQKQAESKRKRKYKKKRTDDFVVDDDEPIKPEPMDDDNASNSDGDSSDPEYYKEHKRIRVTKKSFESEEQMVSNVDAELAEEAENEFALGDNDIKPSTDSPKTLVKSKT